jgi:hypothetical protein
VDGVLWVLHTSVLLGTTICQKIDLSTFFRQHTIVVAYNKEFILVISKKFFKHYWLQIYVNMVKLSNYLNVLSMVLL